MSFSVEQQSVFDPVTSQKRHLAFQVISGPSRPTQATSRSKIIKPSLKIVALARLHPLIRLGWRRDRSSPRFDESDLAIVMRDHIEVR